jgi:hypothetical protein
MNDKETFQCEMVLRVDQLCSVDQAGDFTNQTNAGKFAQLIHTIVPKLNEQIGKQAAARRLAQASTDSKDAARQLLRALVEQMRDTARGMDADAPGTSTLFKLTSRTDEALLAAARAFQINAQPLEAEFIRNEMPADFLAQLQQYLAAFEQASAAQSTHLAEQVAATTALRTLLAEALRAVKQLHPIVRNKYRKDSGKLAAWRNVSRVERVPKRKTATEAATPPAKSEKQ